MSRHVDDIKTMLFDEPDFDSDDEIKSKTARRKERKKIKKQSEEKTKPSVETIVFRDRAKKRKPSNVRQNFVFPHTILFVYMYIEIRDSNTSISTTRKC
jgi:hypothetical protein